ncbi:hypothetical protein SUGI_1099850 [Cryptomeria japonica]|nr:hypothetical protein SUGI_1099850 [Cryptomeria japonica]
MAHLACNAGVLALLLFACLCEGTEMEYMQNGSYVPGKVLDGDVDLVEFPLNLEYLEAEFFLFGALGYGLDVVAPELPCGGPPRVGGMKANLNSVVHHIILEFAYQEVGHLR